jgi:hypothetical protein
MNKFKIPAAFLLLTAFVVGCGEQPPTAVNEAVSTPMGIPLLSDGPVEVPFFAQFDDFDPCTGLPQTYTMTGTMFIKGNVVRIKRTVTGSLGYEGGGTFINVVNGQIDKITLADILTNESTGDKQRAVLVIVFEHGTLRVIAGAIACIRT